ncbi:hypothetical protein [Fredinandcohnia sp. 179-A 10B2 NHS]|uniref:hypothetical protein n=1 Tax=Fredinandcohnia sp. 179-A 10B2 NHS TaxID=3235176 RepID=UPI0039A33478
MVLSVYYLKEKKVMNFNLAFDGLALGAVGSRYKSNVLKVKERNNLQAFRLMVHIDSQSGALRFSIVEGF